MHRMKVTLWTIFKDSSVHSGMLPSPPSSHGNLFILHNWNSAPVKNSPPPLLATTILLPALWLWLPWVTHVSRILVSILLWLAYATQHNIFKVHPCYECVRIHFLSLNNIPLYLCSTFCFPTHLLMDIFNLLTVVNNAAVDRNFRTLFSVLWVYLMWNSWINRHL